MKKLMTLVLLLAIGSMSYAQKNELKAIEKALKNVNFSDAKAAISSAEALIGNMDDKSKAKFYYLKAQALYANGAGTDANIDDAIETLDQLKTLESSIGKLKYTEQANDMKSKMFNTFITKANDAFNSNNFEAAADRFEKIYRISPQDTSYLYSAAYSSIKANDYPSALGYYIELGDLGYTGIAMNHFATDKESGEEVLYADKAGRDFAVKTLKTHIKPRDVKTESRRSEIVKNIALIYADQGESEKALAATVEARAENPDDLGLIVVQAQTYLKLGNKDKFTELIDEASAKADGNAEFLYNLGALLGESDNTEEAKKYYQKALDVDPNYNNANLNMAFVILSDEAKYIEEMNAILESNSPNYNKYDEIKAKVNKLYLEAIPYLEKSLSLNESINTAKNLMNLYSAIGDTDKFKAMKAKYESMEAAAGGN
ncbi:tetratricopeptide repeat protein [uncultured Winogradskyella sp.]|uniref:tetratricopeptide repeat protein n=1 Tax=uncultured Winogradskyella sp. TaxID=395353 RepID=UPI00262A5945|nr:tetratricopeptide repeat protein [uncultured Winogradskyella sp.]|tara:strand:+ start:4937 stop:6226 length:1290 start_codon:yes stop_codon:yes gene_type:complete